jgi:hypothetical protein
MSSLNINNLRKITQGFHKITLPDGGKAELNRGSGKSPSFLWYHDGAGRGDPIVELMVVHGDSTEMAPNFEKVTRDMLKGSSESAYLAFRRSRDVDPIGEIRILYGAGEPDEGFVKITPAILGEGDTAVFIACKYISKGESLLNIIDICVC